MRNRWMAVVLGAAVLAVPGTALAKGDHAKGHGKEKASHHEKAEKHGKKDKSAKKPKSYVFKGVYKGDGVVTVSGGNSRVRKGGYVGQDVTFDLSKAKGDAAVAKAGDKVLVQARLPRGTKAPETSEAPVEVTSEAPVVEEAPAAIVARKLVVLSRTVSEDDAPEHEQEPAEAPETD